MKFTGLGRVNLLYVCAALVLICSCALAMKSSAARSYAHAVAGELQPKRFRYTLLYSGENEYFIEKLDEGVKTAMQDDGVWVTFLSFGTADIETHLDEFEKAIESGVDGIITNVPDTSRIGALIDRAAGEKIPVITICSDIYGSQRKTFIGLDYYAVGQMAAEILQELTDSSARTMAISYPPSSQNAESRLKLGGFREYVQAVPGMSLGVEYMGELDYFSAYNLAASLLESKINYDSFFCIDEMTTLAVAQCVEKMGRQRDVTVIGCGNTQRTYEYIRQGVLDAVLVEDPFSVGYMAVRYMTKFKDGEVAPPLIVDTEIRSATRENIDEFYNS